MFFNAFYWCSLVVKIIVKKSVLNPVLIRGQKHLLLVIFRVHSWFQRIKNMKNEANLNNVKLTVTSFSTVVYNALQTKTKKGTNPNKPNLKTKLLSVLLARRPVGVVLYEANFKKGETVAFG